MPMDFQSQYLVSVTVDQLDQLEKLRAELKGVLLELDKGVTLKVGLELDDADLKQQVQRLVEQAMAGAGGKVHTTPGTAQPRPGTPGEPAAHAPLDIDALARAIVTSFRQAHQASGGVTTPGATHSGTTPVGSAAGGAPSGADLAPPSGASPNARGLDPAKVKAKLQDAKKRILERRDRAAQWLEELNHADTVLQDALNDPQVGLSTLDVLRELKSAPKFASSASHLSLEALADAMDERRQRLTERAKQVARSLERVDRLLSDDTELMTRVTSSDHGVNWRSGQGRGTATGGGIGGGGSFGGGLGGSLNLGRMDSQLNALSSLIQKKIVDPLMALADVDLRGLLEQLKQMPSMVGHPGAPGAPGTGGPTATATGAQHGPAEPTNEELFAGMNLPGTFKRYGESMALMMKVLGEAMGPGMVQGLKSIKVDKLSESAKQRARKERTEAEAAQAREDHRQKVLENTRSRDGEATFARRQQVVGKEKLVSFPAGVGLQAATRQVPVIRQVLDARGRPTAQTEKVYETQTLDSQQQINLNQRLRIAALQARARRVSIADTLPSNILKTDSAVKNLRRGKVGEDRLVPTTPEEDVYFRNLAQKRRDLAVERASLNTQVQAQQDKLRSIEAERKAGRAGLTYDRFYNDPDVVATTAHPLSLDQRQDRERQLKTAERRRKTLDTKQAKLIEQERLLESAHAKGAPTRDYLNDPDVVRATEGIQDAQERARVRSRLARELQVHDNERHKTDVEQQLAQVRAQKKTTRDDRAANESRIETLTSELDSPERARRALARERLTKAKREHEDTYDERLATEGRTHRDLKRRLGTTSRTLETIGYEHLLTGDDDRRALALDAEILRRSGKLGTSTRANAGGGLTIGTGAALDHQFPVLGVKSFEALIQAVTEAKKALEDFAAQEAKARAAGDESGALAVNKKRDRYVEGLKFGPEHDYTYEHTFSEAEKAENATNIQAMRTRAAEYRKKLGKDSPRTLAAEKRAEDYAREYGGDSQIRSVRLTRKISSDAKVAVTDLDELVTQLTQKGVFAPEHTLNDRPTNTGALVRTTVRDSNPVARLLAQRASLETSPELEQLLNARRAELAGVTWTAVNSPAHPDHEAALGKLGERVEERLAAIDDAVGEHLDPAAFEKKYGAQASTPEQQRKYLELKHQRELENLLGFPAFDDQGHGMRLTVGAGRTLRDDEVQASLSGQTLKGDAQNTSGKKLQMYVTSMTKSLDAMVRLTDPTARGAYIERRLPEIRSDMAKYAAPFGGDEQAVAGADARVKAAEKEWLEAMQGETRSLAKMRQVREVAFDALDKYRGELALGKRLNPAGQQVDLTPDDIAKRQQLITENEAVVKDLSRKIYAHDEVQNATRARETISQTSFPAAFDAADRRIVSAQKALDVPVSATEQKLRDARTAAQAALTALETEQKQLQAKKTLSATENERLPLLQAAIQQLESRVGGYNQALKPFDAEHQGRQTEFTSALEDRAKLQTGQAQRGLTLKLLAEEHAALESERDMLRLRTERETLQRELTAMDEQIARATAANNTALAQELATTRAGRGARLGDIDTALAARQAERDEYLANNPNATLGLGDIKGNVTSFGQAKGWVESLQQGIDVIEQLQSVDPKTGMPTRLPSRYRTEGADDRSLRFEAVASNFAFRRELLGKAQAFAANPATAPSAEDLAHMGELPKLLEERKQAAELVDSHQKRIAQAENLPAIDPTSPDAAIERQSQEFLRRQATESKGVLDKVTAKLVAAENAVTALLVDFGKDVSKARAHMTDAVVRDAAEKEPLLGQYGANTRALIEKKRGEAATLESDVRYGKYSLAERPERLKQAEGLRTEASALEDKLFADIERRFTGTKARASGKLMNETELRQHFNQIIERNPLLKQMLVGDESLVQGTDTTHGIVGHLERFTQKRDYLNREVEATDALLPERQKRVYTKADLPQVQDIQHVLGELSMVDRLLGDKKFASARAKSLGLANPHMYNWNDHDFRVNDGLGGERKINIHEYKTMLQGQLLSGLFGTDPTAVDPKTGKPLGLTRGAPAGGNSTEGDKLRWMGLSTAMFDEQTGGYTPLMLQTEGPLADVAEEYRKRFLTASYHDLKRRGAKANRSGHGFDPGELKTFLTDNQIGVADVVATSFSGKSGGTAREFVEAMLKEGASHEETLAAVKAQFPNRKWNGSALKWVQGVAGKLGLTEGEMASERQTQARGRGKAGRTATADAAEAPGTKRTPAGFLVEQLVRSGLDNDTILAQVKQHFPTSKYATDPNLIDNVRKHITRQQARAAQTPGAASGAKQAGEQAAAAEEQTYKSANELMEALLLADGKRKKSAEAILTTLKEHFPNNKQTMEDVVRKAKKLGIALDGKAGGKRAPGGAHAMVLDLLGQGMDPAEIYKQVKQSFPKTKYTVEGVLQTGVRQGLFGRTDGKGAGKSQRQKIEEIAQTGTGTLRDVLGLRDALKEMAGTDMDPLVAAFTAMANEAERAGIALDKHKDLFLLLGEAGRKAAVMEALKERRKTQPAAETQAAKPKTEAEQQAEAEAAAARASATRRSAIATLEASIAARERQMADRARQQANADADRRYRAAQPGVGASTTLPEGYFDRVMEWQKGIAEAAAYAEDALRDFAKAAEAWSRTTLQAQRAARGLPAPHIAGLLPYVSDQDHGPGTARADARYGYEQYIAHAIATRHGPQQLGRGRGVVGLLGVGPAGLGGRINPIPDLSQKSIPQLLHGLAIGRRAEDVDPFYKEYANDHTAELARRFATPHALQRRVPTPFQPAGLLGRPGPTRLLAPPRTPDDGTRYATGSAYGPAILLGDGRRLPGYRPEPGERQTLNGRPITNSRDYRRFVTGRTASDTAHQFAFQGQTGGLTLGDIEHLYGVARGVDSQRRLGKENAFRARLQSGLFQNPDVTVGEAAQTFRRLRTGAPTFDTLAEPANPLRARLRNYAQWRAGPAGREAMLLRQFGHRPKPGERANITSLEKRPILGPYPVDHGMGYGDEDIYPEDWQEFMYLPAHRTAFGDRPIRTGREYLRARHRAPGFAHFLDKRGIAYQDMLRSRLIAPLVTREQFTAGAHRGDFLDTKVTRMLGAYPRQGAPGYALEAGATSADAYTYRDEQGLIKGLLEFYRTQTGEAAVGDTWVHPKLRRQGIGRQLYKGLETHMPVLSGLGLMLHDGAGNFHYRSVEEALQRGEQVDPSILNSYPKLRQRYNQPAGLLPAVAGLRPGDGSFSTLPLNRLGSQTAGLPGLPANAYRMPGVGGFGPVSPVTLLITEFQKLDQTVAKVTQTLAREDELRRSRNLAPRRNGDAPLDEWLGLRRTAADNVQRLLGIKPGTDRLLLGPGRIAQGTVPASGPASTYDPASTYGLGNRTASGRFYRLGQPLGPAIPTPPIPAEQQFMQALSQTLQQSLHQLTAPAIAGLLPRFSSAYDQGVGQYGPGIPDRQTIPRDLTGLRIAQLLHGQFIGQRGAPHDRTYRESAADYTQELRRRFENPLGDATSYGGPPLLPLFKDLRLSAGPVASRLLLPATTSAVNAGLPPLTQRVISQDGATVRVPPPGGGGGGQPPKPPKGPGTALVPWEDPDAAGLKRDQAILEELKRREAEAAAKMLAADEARKKQRQSLLDRLFGQPESLALFKSNQKSKFRNVVDFLFGQAKKDDLKIAVEYVQQLKQQISSMQAIEQELRTLDEVFEERKSKGLPTDKINAQMLGARDRLHGAQENMRQVLENGEAAVPGAFEAYKQDLAGFLSKKQERRAAQGEHAEAVTRLNAATTPADQKAAAADVAAAADKVGKARDEENQYAKAINERARAHARAANELKNHEGFLGKFQRTFRNILFYATAGGLGFMIFGQISQAVKEAVQLEQALARIQGVLRTHSSAERESIRTGVERLAGEFGVSPIDVVGNVQTFAQAGYQGQRALEATRASLLGQKGLGLSPEQSQELLIATDNISGGSIGLTEILDRISRTESTRAVSAQDLSLVLQRSGSIAKQLQPQSVGGIDFADILLGLGTSAVEKTRIGGGAAATGIKFILSRLTSPEIGNSLQKNFGINLATKAGGTEMRPLMDILSDIGAKYKEYQSGGQTIRANELLQTVAGQRQINTAAAIFENFGEAMDVARQASVAFGDAEHRAALVMDTFGAQLGRLRTNFAEFISNLAERTGLFDTLSDFLKGLNDKLTNANVSGPGSVGLLEAGGTAALVGGIGSVGLRSVLLGSGPAALAEGGALAGATAAGASIFGSIAVLGTITAIIGSLLTAGFEGQKRKMSNQFREEQEGGPKEFDVDKFRKSEFYREYTGLATKFERPDQVAAPSALYDRVQKAVKTAINVGLGADGRDTNGVPLSLYGGYGNLAARGLRPYAIDARVHNLEGGDYDKLIGNLMESLDRTLPGFKDITDESERMRVAMDLLTQSLKYGTAAAAEQAAAFQLQTSQAFTKAREQIDRARDPEQAKKQRALTQANLDEVRKTRFSTLSGEYYNPSTGYYEYGGATGSLQGNLLNPNNPEMQNLLRVRREARDAAGLNYTKAFADESPTLIGLTKGSKEYAAVEHKVIYNDVASILDTQFGGALAFSKQLDGGKFFDRLITGVQSGKELGAVFDTEAEGYRVTEAQQASINLVERRAKEQLTQSYLDRHQESKGLYATDPDALNQLLAQEVNSDAVRTRAQQIIDASSVLLTKRETAQANGKPLDTFLTPEEQTQIDQRRRTIRQQLVGDRPGKVVTADDVETVLSNQLRDEGGPNLASTYAKQTDLQTAADRMLDERFHLKARLAAARGLPEGATGGQPGTAGATVLLTGAEELARQRLLELQNQNPTNDAIKGMLAALQDQAGRTSGPAALLTRGKAQRAVKDYLLEAMLGYGIQNTGAIRFGEYSRQTGLEDRTVEERASASTQVLRRLSEVPSQINAEIIRLQDKATQTGAYQSFMEQNFVDEGERPAKLTQGFEAFRAALAKGDIRSDDVVNLDRQGGILVSGAAGTEERACLR
jgi:GNAT superfamily N-acetyltransferase